MTVKTVSRSRRSCPRRDYRQLHTFSSTDDPTLRLPRRRLRKSAENVFAVDRVVASRHRRGEVLSIYLLLSFWDSRPSSNSELLSCLERISCFVVDLPYFDASRELYLRELQDIGFFKAKFAATTLRKSRGQIPPLRPTIAELNVLVQENGDFVCDREWRRI